LNRGAASSMRWLGSAKVFRNRNGEFVEIVKGIGLDVVT
jgi:hypothetical protein